MTNDNTAQQQQQTLVKYCPLKVPSRDFFLGGAVVAALGVGYWFIRCRGRKC